MSQITERHEQMAPPELAVGVRRVIGLGPVALCEHQRNAVAVSRATMRVQADSVLPTAIPDTSGAEYPRLQPMSLTECERIRIFGWPLIDRWMLRAGSGSLGEHLVTPRSSSAVPRGFRQHERARHPTTRPIVASSRSTPLRRCCSTARKPPSSVGGSLLDCHPH